MESLSESLANNQQIFAEEYEKFQNGNNAAGTRARKALSEIGKLSKELRKQIQEQKNAQ